MMKLIRDYYKILTIISLMVIVSISFIIYRSSDAVKFNKQIDLGQKYFGEENYAEAIIAFNEAIAIEPNNIQTYVYALDAYIMNDKNDDLISFYENTLSVVVALDEEELIKNKDYVVALYLAVIEVYDDLEQIIYVLEQGYRITGDEQIYKLLNEKIKEKEFLEIEKEVSIEEVSVEAEESEIEITEDTLKEIPENIVSVVQEDGSNYGTYVGTVSLEHNEADSAIGGWDYDYYYLNFNQNVELICDFYMDETLSDISVDGIALSSDSSLDEYINQDVEVVGRVIDSGVRDGLMILVESIKVLGSSEEWIDDLANNLLADDYQAVLDILRNREGLRDKCKKYELSDWALWDYERAYSMTASDGTVVGIVYYDFGSEGFEIDAFVSYTPEKGFEYTQAGDHHVIYHTDRGWGEWTYLMGQTIYYEKNREPFDIGEDGIYSVWHM